MDDWLAENQIGARAYSPREVVMAANGDGSWSCIPMPKIAWLGRHIGDSGLRQALADHRLRTLEQASRETCERVWLAQG